MEIITDLKSQFNIYMNSLIEYVPKLATALIIVIIMSFILKMVRKKLASFLSEKADDQLLVNFINSLLHIVNIIIIGLLFLYVLGLGGIAGSFLGAAGISAFVIGFALKDIGENFLAGVVMAFDRPFSIGDTIKTNDVEGVIKTMSLRDTHVKTFDGKDVFVPNGQIIKNPLYNYTMDGYMRQNFLVGIDYNSDTDQARQIILDELDKIPGILGDVKPPRTHIKNLNTSTIDIECYFWINTFDRNHSGLELKSMAQSKSIKALMEAGVGMPSDIVELKNYDGKLSVQNM